MYAYIATDILSAMASEVVKVGYLMKGEIFIVPNFENACLQQVSCIYSLSVHGNV